LAIAKLTNQDAFDNIPAQPTRNKNLPATRTFRPPLSPPATKRHSQHGIVMRMRREQIVFVLEVSQILARPVESRRQLFVNALRRQA
jgi:hypothetical protein